MAHSSGCKHLEELDDELLEELDRLQAMETSLNPNVQEDPLAEVIIVQVGVRTGTKPAFRTTSVRQCLERRLGPISGSNPSLAPSCRSGSRLRAAKQQVADRHDVVDSVGVTLEQHEA